MYTGASQAFHNVQATSLAEVMAKVQILDQNENLLQEIVQRVEDGSIKVDKTSKDIRRSFSLTLDNSQGLLQVGWPTGIWLNNRLKLWTGFQTTIGVTEYVPQGVFVLRQPKATSKPDEANIVLQGEDKSSLLNGNTGGKLGDTLVITQGTNVGTAIQTVAQLGGVTNFNFVPCNYTVPYTMSFQVGETLWRAINQMAWSISWQVFFDRNGYLVFRPQPDYTTLAPVLTLSTNPNGVNPYMGTEKVIDDTGQNAANHIVVIGGSAQTGTVRAEAIDSSTQSATSTTTLGQDRVRVIQDPIITTVQLAQARANYELQNSVIAAEKQTITMVPNYLLDEEDVITLNDPTVGTNKNYVLITLDIPLRWDKEMTCEAWEARNVLAENNIAAVNGP